tara:strand:+ start:205 stop:471 length:267 start_codon:yes stop_codon:yes gene_type:complete
MKDLKTDIKPGSFFHKESDEVFTFDSCEELIGLIESLKFNSHSGTLKLFNSTGYMIFSKCSTKSLIESVKNYNKNEQSEVTIIHDKNK